MITNFIVQLENGLILYLLNKKSPHFCEGLILLVERTEKISNLLMQELKQFKQLNLEPNNK
jgi:hypothetical protein